MTHYVKRGSDHLDAPRKLPLRALQVIRGLCSFKLSAMEGEPYMEHLGDAGWLAKHVGNLRLARSTNISLPYAEPAR